MLEFLPIRSQNFGPCDSLSCGSSPLIERNKLLLSAESDVIIAGNKFTPEITFLVLYQTEYFAQKF